MSRRIALCLVACAAMLVGSPARGGGSWSLATVESFSRKTDLSADLKLQVTPGEEELFLGHCRVLEVHARYAWWKWWWNDMRGEVSRQRQKEALDVLEHRASSKTPIDFGYMGEGWRAPDAKRPCAVVSNAVVLHRDEASGSTHTYVLSYYTAP